VRELAPEIRLGWSVPRVRKDPFRSPFTAVPAIGMVQVLRRTLPRRCAKAIADGRVEAIMANVHVVSAAMVRAIDAVGGELYVWTVDEEKRIDWLRELGVTGVISNDPRLLQPAK
jgi:glycerophosphoryl diester phosphodiesterase